MVKHHFHASSWPTNHPRFKHPVYGEVEKCNWNMECVKLWDANTAFFDGLPEEERLKIIGIKEMKDMILGGTLPPVSSTPGRYEKRDVMNRYVDHVMSFIDASIIKPFNVVLDAGSGVAGYVPLASLASQTGYIFKLIQ